MEPTNKELQKAQYENTEKNKNFVDKINLMMIQNDDIKKKIVNF